MTLDNRSISEVQGLFAEATKNPLRGMLGVMQLVGIASHLEGARKQVARIAENLALSNESPASREKAIEQALMDVHFYFICWHAVHQHITVLRSISGLRSPTTVWKRYRVHLEHFSRGRDHLEHYPDRLRGKKNKKGEGLARPGYLGDLDALGTYFFGGDSFDVTTKSLAVLDEIVAAVIRESIDEARSIVGPIAPRSAPN